MSEPGEAVVRQRPARPWRGAWDLFVLVGRVVAYSVLALCFVVSAVVGVVAAVDHSRPITWGTFTQQRCEVHLSRLGETCTSVGKWTSDDGTVTLDDMTLDGINGGVATTRAGIRLGGPFPDTVHTADWVDGALWVPWMICLGALIAFFASGPFGLPDVFTRRRR